MYVPDLTNLSEDQRYAVLAIGLLDQRRAFSAGPSACAEHIDTAERLVAFTLERRLAVLHTRGIHRCNICRDESSGSNSCILVPTDDPNAFFLTNFLLPHYITEHFLAPPEAFVIAMKRDYAAWPVFPLNIERCISVTSVEGEAIERERIRELDLKHPGLYEEVYGEPPERGAQLILRDFPSIVD
ncbi:MAG: hypothetical protein ABI411_19810 [Tahibacter sp.]